MASVAEPKKSFFAEIDKVEKPEDLEKLRVKYFGPREGDSRGSFAFAWRYAAREEEGAPSARAGIEAEGRPVEAGLGSPPAQGNDADDPTDCQSPARGQLEAPERQITSLEEGQ